MRFFALIIGICRWGRGSPLFVVLLCVSLYMLYGTNNQKQNIADILLSSIFYLPQSFSSYLLNIKNLGEENIALKKENIRLKFEINTAREYVVENVRLKRLLSFENEWDYPIILAQIIGYNPGDFLTTIIVNVGSSDSISYGMPVLTMEGLVGRVSKVFPRHSHVQLLSDQNSRVSVIAQRSRTLGTMSSHNNGDMVIGISSYADLKNGDTLITSGIGGVFPKGIPVGVVSRFERSNSEIISYGNVNLFQNLGSFEEVFIIRKYADWTVW